MKRRILIVSLCIVLFAIPVRAETIRWVDFGVPYESLKYAMDMDTNMLATLSEDLGEAMVGINEDEISLLMAERGKQ